jgi:hypothetical protein
MACPLRLELAGGLYHATFRGGGREDIYLDETAIRTGLDARSNRFGYFDQWVLGCVKKGPKPGRYWKASLRLICEIRTGPFHDLIDIKVKVQVFGLGDVV